MHVIPEPRRILGGAWRKSVGLAFVLVSVPTMIVARTAGADASSRTPTAAVATTSSTSTSSTTASSTTTSSTTTSTTASGSVPVVAITPSDGLRDLETVSVSVGGYTPGSTVSLAQCLLRAGEPAGICNGANLTTAQTDSSGGFATSMVVRRIIGQSASTTDCAAAPMACGIEAAGEGEAGSVLVVATLTFDPSVPAIQTIIDVQPGDGLYEGASVQVRGVGFTPNADVVVAQCPVGTFALEACDMSGRTASRTGSNGAFEVPFVVHAVMIPTGPGGEPEPLTPVDCRSQSCRITAVNKLGASEHADATIVFASTSAKSAQLAVTGGAPRPLALVGGGLLVLGLGLLAATRSREERRRRRPS